MRTDPPEGFNLPEFLEGIYTFQKWELFPGHVTKGPKDVVEHMRRLDVPKSLSGKRVLDIAPWNGFFGFECVRRGAAEVVSLGPDDPDLTGYNKVRDLLQIDNCQYIRASVYDLSPDVHGTFDIVFFLGLIYHLRHPLLALDRIYDVTSDRLFADSPIIDGGVYDTTVSEHGRNDFPTQGTSLQHMPITYFTKGSETGDAYNWFMPNSPAFRDFVESSGFAVDSYVDDGSWASLSATKSRRRFTPGVEGWNRDAIHHKNIDDDADAASPASQQGGQQGNPAQRQPAQPQLPDTGTRPPRLWLDVEDLLRYVEVGHRRPTGIQRGNFELYRALHEEYGTQVQFVRHHPGHGLYVTVAWESILASFESLTLVRSPIAAPVAPTEQRYVARGAVRRFGERIPPGIRLPLGRIARGQIDTLLALPALAGGVVRYAFTMARAALAKPPPPDAPKPPPLFFAAELKPGDAVTILGTPLFREDYDVLARAACKRHGVRFGMLVHDLVPIRHPEWQARPLLDVFDSWMQRMLPLCDTVFAFSRATATDVERYAEERGLTLTHRVCRIPHGQRRGGPLTAAPSRTARLPEPGSYVLFVSTIEPRKNHALLFRVWRRLLEEMPAGRVPRLVFAGGVGWLVADLLQQFENSNWLDGNIVFIREPDDAELAALYQGCLFTIYPSLHEGWGLPVTESLAFGKPCMASNATSLPEAGGALARYFDPEDVAGATLAIRQVIADRAGLATWQAQVQAEFRPVPWSETARAVGQAFGLKPGQDRQSSAAAAAGTDEDSAALVGLSVR